MSSSPGPIEIVILLGFALGALLFILLIAAAVWGIITQARGTALTKSLSEKLPGQQELFHESVNRQRQSFDLQQESMDLQRLSLELQREHIALLKRILDALESRPNA